MNRKIVVLIIVIIVVLISVFTAINLLKFRVTSVSPNGDTFPTSSREIVVFFNRKLDESTTKEKDNIKLVGAELRNSYVKDNELHILIADFVSSEEIEVNIDYVVSDTNQILGDITKKYRVDYVPFEKLSEYEKEKQINQSDSFESEYPIIKILPILNNQYTVNYRIPYNQGSVIDQKLFLIIDVLAVTNDPDFPKDAKIRSYIETTRKKAINDIESRGYKITDFNVLYAENPPGD